MEGGDLQVATWIKDEGFDTTIPSVMQVQHPNSMHMDMLVLGSRWRLAFVLKIARPSCNLLCMFCRCCITLQRLPKLDRPWHDSIDCLQMLARYLHAHVPKS